MRESAVPVVVAYEPSPKLQTYVQESPRVPPAFVSVLASVKVASRFAADAEKLAEGA